MAISVAFPVGKETAKAFTAKLKTAINELKPGHYEDKSAYFGALISTEGKESVEQSIDKAEKEGANIVLDGRNHQVENNDSFFLGVTLIDNVIPNMDIYKE